MPVVKKQVAPATAAKKAPPAAQKKPSPTTPTAKTEGVWGRVVPVTEHDSGGIHVSLYGRSKTGKTRFICTFPKPILIIGAEDGTKSIQGLKGIDFIRIRTTAEFEELVPGIIERGYATAALDTASAFADVVLEEVTGRETPQQNAWGAYTREEYMAQAKRMKPLLKMLLDLPCNVVITAHEKNLTAEEGHQELMVPSVGSALGKSTVGWLNGAVDYICQTFIRQKMQETTFEINGEKQTTMEIVPGAKPEFCLRCGPHPVYQTGFRLTPGFELPEVIVDPDYAQVMQIINGKYHSK